VLHPDCLTELAAIAVARPLITEEGASLKLEANLAAPELSFRAVGIGSYSGRVQEVVHATLVAV
jgi:hypothetical protein